MALTEEEKKERKSIYNKAYREKHKERCRSLCAKWKLNNPDIANFRSEKSRKSNNQYCQKSRDELHDRYIRQKLVVLTSLTARDIPQDMVELKRQHIRIMRLIKERKTA